MKDGLLLAQLVAGLLFATLGLLTVFTGHSGNVREMRASSPAAYTLAVLLLTVGTVILTGWIRKVRASRK